MKPQIPISEITKRHPDMLYCPTDREYANLANDIYDMIGKAFAEMIRIDMDDPDDEIAAEIEKMEYAKLNIYKIQNTDKEYLVVEDFRKQRYNVALDSFGHDFYRWCRMCKKSRQPLLQQE